MILHTLTLRVQRDINETLERGAMNTATITMRWVDRTLPDNYDVNDESTYPVPTPMSAPIAAMLHFISARTNLQGFYELKAGDCVATFAPDAPLDGKEGLTFVLPDGNVYAQTAVGGEITKYWDAVIQGDRTSRTVALRLV